MKRFIRTSKYLDEHDYTLLFDDSVFINIELDSADFTGGVIDASSDLGIYRFPGIDQFKADVLSILEREYEFEVIEDFYDGKLQKGHISNRDDSISVYFDTYFDLAKASNPISRLGITNLRVPEESKCKIACFIHIRFSDHKLNDLGDLEHRRFVKQNAEKYTQNRGDVSMVIEEENITIRPDKMQLRYNEAIEDLRTDLDFRIASWVKKAQKYI